MILLRIGVVLVSFAVLGLKAGIALAVIPDQSESFADGNFADDAALLAAGYTFSAGGGLDAAQVFGDADGGDGENDGGIFVDGEAIEGSVQYPFAGTIENGVEYRFGAQLFKSGASFVEAEVELLAGNTVVASLPMGEATVTGSGPATDPMGPDSTASGTFPATLYYRGDSGTAGQALSFRVKQTRGFGASFDVGIDNWELAAVDLSAPIADQSETFTGFAPIGYEWTVAPARYLESDNDPLTPPDGANPGDAALDGGIWVDGNNAGVPQSIVEYRFDGAIEDGQRYDFSTYLFQSSTSYALTTVELIADPGGTSEAVVASSDPDLVVNGRPDNPNGAFLLAEVSYTGDSSTAGKGLAFRISSDRDGGGSSSEVAIDGWSLTLVDGVDGDYNEDGVVNLADYTIWRDTLGSSSDLRADGNNNNQIDAGDYTVWKNNFGAPAAATLAATTAVPEPASLLLFASAVLCVCLRRRDR